MLSLLALLFFATQGWAAPSPPFDSVAVAFDWTPNTNHTGFYVAKAKGYFEKEKIKVRFLQPTQTTATQLTGAGRAEFGISFTSDLFRARARGVPVRSIAAVIQEGTTCFASRKKAGIRSVKDWEKKRYGGWGSPEEETTLRYLMEKNGADFSKVKIVTTGVSDFLPTTEKNADFMWIFMGWDGVRAALAGVELDTLCGKDLDPVFDRPSPLVITSEKLIRENPDLIGRFMRALAQGYQLAIDSPELASQLLLQEVPELDAKLVKASAHFLAPKYAARTGRWGEQEAQSWKKIGKWFLDQKLLEKIEEPAAYFDNSFLPKKGSTPN